MINLVEKGMCGKDRKTEVIMTSATNVLIMMGVNVDIAMIVIT